MDYSEKDTIVAIRNEKILISESMTSRQICCWTLMGFVVLAIVQVNFQVGRDSNGMLATAYESFIFVNDWFIVGNLLFAFSFLLTMFLSLSVGSSLRRSSKLLLEPCDILSWERESLRQMIKCNIYSRMGFHTALLSASFGVICIIFSSRFVSVYSLVLCIIGVAFIGALYSLIMWRLVRSKNEIIRS